jgi:ubiquinone/menaquinone biosynthesis C-methylase UbiE
MRAQYDSIGNKFGKYTETATHRHADAYTVFQMIGQLDGKNVLDMACGQGHYTRKIKQRNALKVIGVDISAEMIRLARLTEEDERAGIEYLVADCSAPLDLGEFDIITAVFLFNYAESEDRLLSMFKVAYRHLALGGKLVAYTVNPDYSLESGNFAKYGVEVLSDNFAEDGYNCESQFMTTPPTRFNYFKWSKDTYEKAAKQAGFKTLAWHSTEVSPEDLTYHGVDYWGDFHKNCLTIGLHCTK